MEQETSGLLRALDEQKSTSLAQEQALRKRIDDGLHEVAIKVRRMGCDMSVLAERSNQEGETESLRARLRYFSDYDEIKRELEIMKVFIAVSFFCAPVLILPISMLNSVVRGTEKKMTRQRLFQCLLQMPRK